MKKILPIIIAAVAAPTVSGQVRWLDPTHDFGAFSEDLGNVTAEFKMVNEGETPVKILDARATCGCTVPEFPKRAVAPGDTLALKVTYNASGRPGKFEKFIYVKTSNAPQEQRTLTVKGVVIGASATIRSRYPVDAGALQLQSDIAGFGEVKRGKTKTVFINLYNRSEKAVEPNIAGLPAYVSAQFTPVAVPPGQQGQLALTVNTLKMDEWGINEGAFTLKAGDDEKEMKYFAIVMEDFDRLTPGQRMNAPAVEVSPAKVDLGEVSADTRHTVDFEIKNVGKSLMQIRRVQSVDPAIVSTTLSSDKVKPGKRVRLSVVFDASRAENDFVNARISLITNDPANPMDVVRVTAEIIK